MRIHTIWILQSISTNESTTRQILFLLSVIKKAEIKFNFHINKITRFVRFFLVFFPYLHLEMDSDNSFRKSEIVCSHIWPFVCTEFQFSLIRALWPTSETSNISIIRFICNLKDSGYRKGKFIMGTKSPFWCLFSILKIMWNNKRQTTATKLALSVWNIERKTYQLQYVPN